MLHNIYWYASLSQMFLNEYLEFDLSQYASINQIQPLATICEY